MKPWICPLSAQGLLNGRAEHKGSRVWTSPQPCVCVCVRAGGWGGDHAEMFLAFVFILFFLQGEGAPHFNLNVIPQFSFKKSYIKNNEAWDKIHKVFNASSDYL